MNKRNLTQYFLLLLCLLWSPLSGGGPAVTPMYGPDDMMYPGLDMRYTRHLGREMGRRGYPDPDYVDRTTTLSEDVIGFFGNVAYPFRLVLGNMVYGIADLSQLTQLVDRESIEEMIEGELKKNSQLKSIVVENHRRRQLTEFLRAFDVIDEDHFYMGTNSHDRQSDAWNREHIERGGTFYLPTLKNLTREQIRSRARAHLDSLAEAQDFRRLTDFLRSVGIIYSYENFDPRKIEFYRDEIDKLDTAPWPDHENLGQQFLWRYREIGSTSPLDDLPYGSRFRNEVRKRFERYLNSLEANPASSPNMRARNQQQMTRFLRRIGVLGSNSNYVASNHDYYLRQIRSLNIGVDSESDQEEFLERFSRELDADPIAGLMRPLVVNGAERAIETRSNSVGGAALVQTGMQRDVYLELARDFIGMQIENLSPAGTSPVELARIADRVLINFRACLEEVETYSSDSDDLKFCSDHFGEEAPVLVAREVYLLQQKALLTLGETPVFSLPEDRTRLNRSLRRGLSEFDRCAGEWYFGERPREDDDEDNIRAVSGSLHHALIARSSFNGTNRIKTCVFAAVNVASFNALREGLWDQFRNKLRPRSAIAKVDHYSSQFLACLENNNIVKNSILYSPNPVLTGDMTTDSLIHSNYKAGKGYPRMYPIANYMVQTRDNRPFGENNIVEISHMSQMYFQDRLVGCLNSTKREAAYSLAGLTLDETTSLRDIYPSDESYQDFRGEVLQGSLRECMDQLENLPAPAFDPALCTEIVKNDATKRAFLLTLENSGTAALIEDHQTSLNNEQRTLLDGIKTQAENCFDGHAREYLAMLNRPEELRSPALQCNSQNQIIPPENPSSFDRNSLNCMKAAVRNLTAQALTQKLEQASSNHELFTQEQQRTLEAREMARYDTAMADANTLSEFSDRMESFTEDLKLNAFLGAVETIVGNKVEEQTGQERTMARVWPSNVQENYQAQLSSLRSRREAIAAANAIVENLRACQPRANDLIETRLSELNLLKNQYALEKERFENYTEELFKQAQNRLVLGLAEHELAETFRQRVDDQGERTIPEEDIPALVENLVNGHFAPCFQIDSEGRSTNQEQVTTELASQAELRRNRCLGNMIKQTVTNLSQYFFDKQVRPLFTPWEGDTRNSCLAENANPQVREMFDRGLRELWSHPRDPNIRYGGIGRPAYRPGVEQVLERCLSRVRGVGESGQSLENLTDEATACGTEVESFLKRWTPRVLLYPSLANAFPPMVNTASMTIREGESPESFYRRREENLRSFHNNPMTITISNVGEEIFRGAIRGIDLASQTQYDNAVGKMLRATTVTSALMKMYQNLDDVAGNGGFTDPRNNAATLISGCIARIFEAQRLSSTQRNSRAQRCFESGILPPIPDNQKQIMVETFNSLYNCSELPTGLRLDDYKNSLDYCIMGQLYPRSPSQDYSFIDNVLEAAVLKNYPEESASAQSTRLRSIRQCLNNKRGELYTESQAIPVGFIPGAGQPPQDFLSDLRLLTYSRNQLGMDRLCLNRVESHIQECVAPFKRGIETALRDRAIARVLPPRSLGPAAVRLHEEFRPRARRFFDSLILLNETEFKDRSYDREDNGESPLDALNSLAQQLKDAYEYNPDDFEGRIAAFERSVAAARQRIPPLSRDQLVNVFTHSEIMKQVIKAAIAKDIRVSLKSKFWQAKRYLQSDDEFNSLIDSLTSTPQFDRFFNATLQDEVSPRTLRDRLQRLVNGLQELNSSSGGQVTIDGCELSRQQLEQAIDTTRSNIVLAIVREGIEGTINGDHQALDRAKEEVKEYVVDKIIADTTPSGFVGRALSILVQHEAEDWVGQRGGRIVRGYFDSPTGRSATGAAQRARDALAQNVIRQAALGIPTGETDSEGRALYEEFGSQAMETEIDGVADEVKSSLLSTVGTQMFNNSPTYPSYMGP